MKLTLMVLMISLISACSSTPTVIKHYLLDAKMEPSTKTGTELWRLEPLIMSNHLEQPELLIIASNSQIYYSQLNLWSEPLKHGFIRLLSRNLLSTSDVQLVLPNEPGARALNRSLTIKVDQFAPRDSGDAVLSGTFWVTRSQGMERHAYSFTIPLEKDGFDHSVQQQAKLITQLASAIREAL